MTDKYDVVIVGGGLAGLTSAAYLSRSGYRTLLIERSHETGGLVHTFWHRGYAFDAGIRAFENSGILFPMLHDLGLTVECLSNPVSIGIMNEWTTLRSRDSLQDYQTMLAHVFPQNMTDIERLTDAIEATMGYMDVLYGIDNPLFMTRPPSMKYLKETLLPWLLKYRVAIGNVGKLVEPVQHYLGRVTDNRALVDMVTQHFFKNTPTFFALSYFSLYLDYCYPKGGTGVLPQRLAEFVEAHNGTIVTDEAVTELDAANCQIRTNRQQGYEYRKLVWAADQKTLYQVLRSPTSRPISRQRDVVNSAKGGTSVFSLFLEVNLNPTYFEDRCGPHAFYTASSIGLSSLPAWGSLKPTNQLLEDWVHRYLELTTYEISCPALRDPALAPDGKTGVIVSTLMDYELVRTMELAGAYEAFKDACSRKIVQVLAASVFPDLADHIESTLCATPLTIKRVTGNSEGAITGWAFVNATLPAESRLERMSHAIYTPIPNVYQCGQWSFSPSGLPVSILTGKLASDAVHKSLRR
jgi:phytoene dehydrogenase-like protein